MAIGIGYGVCPKCGKQCWLDVSGPEPEPNMVQVKDRRHVNTDYGPGENWTEVYKCPTCGKVFEEKNGYP